ncbi:MAG: hypothetical protein AAGA58_04615 [Verrucomicrobiota bacterium]
MNARRIFHTYILIVASFIAGCDSQRNQAPPDSSLKPLPLKEILRQAAEIEEVDFPAIIAGSNGKAVLPVGDESSEVMAVLGSVFDEVLEEMNLPTSPVRGLRRINEASRFFEDAIQTRLDELDDFECHVPPNEKGDPQRTGYPDLRIVHQPTESVFYLDPKLYETGSEDSSLRTFYYTPNTGSTKVLEDAHHLLVGIAHDGNDGSWKFLRWQIVDLSKLTVRLKTEIQASNRDLYESNNVILRSSLGSGEPQRRD